MSVFRLPPEPVTTRRLSRPWRRLGFLLVTMWLIGFGVYGLWRGGPGEFFLLASIHRFEAGSAVRLVVGVAGSALLVLVTVGRCGERAGGVRSAVVARLGHGVAMACRCSCGVRSWSDA